MSWVCEYMPNGWNDDPKDGYVVYNSKTNSSIYAYYPSGEDLAKKFAKLCNEFGEKTACKEMGYLFPEEL